MWSNHGWAGPLKTQRRTERLGKGGPFPIKETSTIGVAESLSSLMKEQAFSYAETLYRDIQWPFYIIMNGAGGVF